MDYSLLSESPLFKGLSTLETETMLSKVSFKVKRFKSGSLIFNSGEPITSFIVVTDGVVKGEMTDFAGRVIKIEDIEAPGALAVAFIFGNKNRFPVNVVAVSDCELLMIERGNFLKLLRINDIILGRFLDMISNRSQFLSEKIKFLNFKTIKGKLAHYILQNIGKDGISVTLGMTQVELADYFGVARPSVARALGDLEDDGYIEARGKNIRIINRKGLADLTIE